MTETSGEGGVNIVTWEAKTHQILSNEGSEIFQKTEQEKNG